MADGHVVPEQALYKVLCAVDPAYSPPQALSGKVPLKGKRRARALRFWQAAVGILIRESSLA